MSIFRIINKGEIADFFNLNQKSEKSKNQKPKKNLVLASFPLIMSLICIEKVKRKLHNDLSQTINDTVYE